MSRSAGQRVGRGRRCLGVRVSAWAGAGGVSECGSARGWTPEVSRSAGQRVGRVSCRTKPSTTAQISGGIPPSSSWSSSRSPISSTVHTTARRVFEGRRCGASGSDHHRQSCTPAHELAPRIACAESGRLARQLYGANGPPSCAMTASGAHTRVSAGTCLMRMTCHTGLGGGAAAAAPDASSSAGLVVRGQRTINVRRLLHRARHLMPLFPPLHHRLFAHALGQT